MATRVKRTFARLTFYLVVALIALYVLISHPLGIHQGYQTRIRGDNRSRSLFPHRVTFEV